MYDNGYGDAVYYEQQQNCFSQQQQQQQYAPQQDYDFETPQQQQQMQMASDMGCYGLPTNGEFADINTLEPSIYPGQLLSDHIQHQQQQLQPNQLFVTNNYEGSSPPTATTVDHRPVTFNSSPTDSSSHTSTGSEESEDTYGWHPYKRPPSTVDTLMMMNTGLYYDSHKRMGKTSKKRKPKRDPNEPQKPVSAYALFFRDTQAAIKGHNPNASFGEVSKIVASMWDGLDTDEKNNYKLKTEVAKKDYLKQLAAYRANQLIRSGDSSYSVMDMLGHPVDLDKLNDSPTKPIVPVGSTPDSTTHVLAKESIELGTKSLASLIAEPCPKRVLTATTTLTLRSKTDYDEPSECLVTFPLIVKTKDEAELWEQDFQPNERLVQHCRDVFSLWGQSQPPPPSGAPSGFQPV